jgi:hypothetical protein
MAEAQGDEIIRLLEAILSALERLGESASEIEKDVGTIDTHVTFIEASTSDMAPDVAKIALDVACIEAKSA